MKILLIIWVSGPISLYTMGLEKDWVVLPEAGKATPLSPRTFNIPLPQSIESHLNNLHQMAFLGAAYTNNPTFMQTLLSTQRVNIDCQNPETKDSALHIAIGNDYQAVVTLLLLHRINTTLQNNKGNTALHEAVKTQSVPYIMQIVKYENFNQARRSSSNIYNNKGHTPLHAALKILKKQPDIVSKTMVLTLLQHKALDLNVPTQNNMHTSLHLICLANDIDIAKQLIDRGMCVDVSSIEIASGSIKRLLLQTFYTNIVNEMKKKHHD